MNWKKEGYTVGQQVYIVKKLSFSERKIFSKGTVTHAGTKILKVKKENDNYDQNLVFEERWTSGCMAGYFYEVYKSQQEYEEILSRELDRKTLIGLIEHKIKNLSNEQLEQVEKLVYSFNNNTK